MRITICTVNDDKSVVHNILYVALLQLRVRIQCEDLVSRLANLQQSKMYSVDTMCITSIIIVI